MYRTSLSRPVEKQFTAEVQRQTSVPQLQGLKQGLCLVATSFF